MENDNQKLVEWVEKHNHGRWFEHKIDLSTLKQFEGRVVIFKEGKTEELNVTNLFIRIHKSDYNFIVYDVNLGYFYAPCYGCDVPPTRIVLFEHEDSHKTKIEKNNLIEAYDKSMKSLRNS